MHNSPTFTFFQKPKLKLMMQVEAAECALACIGMISHFHGFKTDLPTLRKRFSISLKGSTLKGLLDISSQLNFSSRSLKVPLEQLSQLQMPCILHWDMNHFVVLDSIKGKTYTIFDPAVGVRKMELKDISDHFTGVAIVLTPTALFTQGVEKINFTLLSLMGNVKGLKLGLIQLFLLGACLQLFALITPFYTQWVVDDAVVSSDYDLLTVLGLGFMGLAVFQSFLTGFRSWCAASISASLNFQWLNNVFSHLLKLPLSYFEKRNIADINSRFNSVETIQRTLTTQFVEAIIDGTLVMATGIIMMYYSVELAFLSIGVVLIYFLFRWILFAPLREANLERILRAATQSNHFMESIRGVQSIRLFGRVTERRSSWLNALVDQVNADLRISRLTILFQTSNTLLFTLERVAVIWICALLTLKGSFSVGMLIAYLSYKEQFSTRLVSLIDKIFEFRMLRLHGERLADIVLHPAQESNPNIVSITNPALNELNSKRSETNVSPSLELKNIRFKYASGEPEVLKGVNLSIPSGQSIAITGPSGSGKTTLVKIILGLLDATEGEIFMDTVRINEETMDYFREHVGTVMQDDALYSASIADNISFFDPTPNNERIIKACAQASILSEIQSMPMGLSTLINEFGGGLSGGQKQRILLARALYRQPKILLLDEATSHLDMMNEKNVNEAIKSMNLTRIIIAHRPETISMADRVVVLHNGTIVQDVLRPKN